MNRIILLGIRDLKTDHTFEANHDYAIMIIASRLSEEKMDSFDETETDSIKYRLKVSQIDDIIDLKTGKQIKYEKGKSPSQKLRWRVCENLGQEEYENFISYLMSRLDQLCDDYREQIK